MEDDLTSLNALRILLGHRGYHVDGVTTLAEALSKLGDDYDCLILDLMLPDGDGIQLLEQVRAQQLPMKVLVTTAVSDPARVQRVKLHAPEKVLRKPIDLAELLRGLTGPSLNQP